jgi:hypothetical protein
MVTVGESGGDFAFTCGIQVWAPANGALNSQNNPANAVLTLVYGWTYPTPQAYSNEISAAADTLSPLVPGTNAHLSAFAAAAGSTIWYYTIWTVDPEITAEAFYNLSITLNQQSS